MNPASEYTMFADNLHDAATNLFIQANREYSTDSAWTSNFDTVAHFMRMRHPDFKPRDAAFTYLMKSIFSIARNHTERQTMRSRYLDAINYLTFMAWMDEHDHDAALMTERSWTEMEREQPNYTTRPLGEADCKTEGAPCGPDGEELIEVPPEWPVYGGTQPPPQPARQPGPIVAGPLKIPIDTQAEKQINDFVSQIKVEEPVTSPEILQDLHKKSVEERIKVWQGIKDRMYEEADNNVPPVTKMSAEHLDKSVGI